MRALRSQDYPVSIIDVGQNHRTLLMVSLDGVAEGNAFGTNLLKLNPYMVPSVYGRLGPSFFEGKRNIGNWGWEMVSFKLNGEVYLDCSMRSGPAAVSFKPISPRCRRSSGPERGTGSSGSRSPNTRARTSDCRRGDSYSSTSATSRASPSARTPSGSEAYRRAFGANAVDTSLCSRFATSTGQPSTPRIWERRVICAHGSARPSTACRHPHRHDHDRGASRPSSRHCDCYVSLHRSRDSGRRWPRRCISVSLDRDRWSGNLDFMTPWNSYLVEAPLVRLDRAFGAFRPGWTSADPDLDHAAALMRRVVEKRRRAHNEGS